MLPFVDSKVQLRKPNTTLPLQLVLSFCLSALKYVIFMIEALTTSVTTVTVLLHFERRFLVRVFMGPDRRTQKVAMTGYGNSQKKTDENARYKTL